MDNPGILSSLLAGVSMFSRIPVPSRPWTPSLLRHALLGWVLVGLGCGAAMCSVGLLAQVLHVVPPVRAALMLACGYAVVGGIHADGMCDAVDALASHASTERRLQIMADAQVGSFAVLALTLDLILSFAFLQGIDAGWRSFVCVGLTPVMSRAIAGLTTMHVRAAHTQGLADTFSRAACKGADTVVLGVAIALSGVALVTLGGVAGGAALVCAALASAWYLRLCLREFGGITGDTCGLFVQVCELLMLAALSIGGGVA